jgi:L-alanine-DL-glutamate epimerase-like enolase superfamily enzyme
MEEHMSKIECISTDLYRPPNPKVYTDSTHGVMADFELLTVRVRDIDGAEGMGYTYTVNAGGSAVRALIDDYLAARLLGQDADLTEKLWQDMWWHLHYAGRGGHVTSAISAIDVALWDLRSRRAQQPLWRYLGGSDPSIPVYAGGIDLDLSIDELLDQSDQFQESGFRAIKMKVGRRNPREDVERAERMREHLGDDFPLMVDANMKWTADEAVRVSRALGDLGLVWLEEPTIPDDVAGHARIVREGAVPVAAGENLHTLYEFENYISAHALSYPEPDVCNCGGITVFRKVCALAEARNLLVTSHGAHDLTVHLLAATSHRTYMEMHGFSLDPFLAKPLQVVDGSVLAPEAPGHGVDLEWDRLEPYRAGRPRYEVRA